MIFLHSSKMYYNMVFLKNGALNIYIILQGHRAEFGYSSVYGKKLFKVHFNGFIPVKMKLIQISEIYYNMFLITNDVSFI